MNHSPDKSPFGFRDDHRHLKKEGKTWITKHNKCELENTFINTFIVLPLRKTLSIINRSNMMLRTEICVTNPQNDFKFRSMYRPTHYKHIYYITQVKLGQKLNRYRLK